MRERVLRAVVPACAISALLGAVLLRAQAPAPADAEFLRRGYDTYRAMAQASPSRGVPWHYLGPTNISGRATDVAVDVTPSTRRIYV